MEPSRHCENHPSLLTLLFPQTGSLSLFSDLWENSTVSVSLNVRQPKPKGWHSCGFYPRVVLPVWYGIAPCEHLLSQNAPGALSHSLWNHTGMLIDLEITRCFLVSISRETCTFKQTHTPLLVHSDQLTPNHLSLVLCSRYDLSQSQISSLLSTVKWCHINTFTSSVPLFPGSHRVRFKWAVSSVSPWLHYSNETCNRN